MGCYRQQINKNKSAGAGSSSGSVTSSSQTLCCAVLCCAALCCAVLRASAAELKHRNNKYQFLLFTTDLRSCKIQSRNIVKQLPDSI